MPIVNVQALIALGMFLASLFIARIVVRIRNGSLPGGEMWVLYLRMLLGFLLRELSRSHFIPLRALMSFRSIFK